MVPDFVTVVPCQTFSREVKAAGLQQATLSVGVINTAGSSSGQAGVTFKSNPVAPDGKVLKLNNKKNKGLCCCCRVARRLKETA